MRREINLDHAATTPPDPAVIKAVCQCMESCDANPSAAYSAAGEARQQIRLAKETLSQMIGCDLTEIIFTSGGTESNNFALRQAAGRHVILSAIEHKSVLEAAKHQGCQITLILPDSNGIINPQKINWAIKGDTALVSVQFANNETGTLQHVSEIGEITRRRNVLFHCDAVQAFGHVPINVQTANIDMLSVSAHKLYGPRGTGFLYIRQNVPAQPLITGSGQEKKLRAGTENVPAIAGFRTAALLAMEDMEERGKRLNQFLKDFVLEIKKQNPQVTEICSRSERLPAVRALHLPGLSSEKAITELDLQGIRVSGRAACGTGSPASHVLLALGIPEKQANEVIRISPGRHTKMEDILYAAEAIDKIIKRC